MTTLSGFVRASVSIALLWVIGAPASAAPAEPVADAALEIVQPIFLSCP